MRTYKALGLLLTYPQTDWLSHRIELLEVLQAEAKLTESTLANIDRLVNTVSSEDLLDAQERYCDTFDRGKGNCLNLFEHVYGESRDRGQAMSELLDLYRAQGLESSGSELPDYLPLYLEFLSRLDPVSARNSLCDTVDVIAVIEARLRQSNSIYAPVMAALVELSKKKINKREIEEAAANSRDDLSFEAIDAAWEEAAAFDGAPDTSCPAPVARQGEAQPITFVANARGVQA